MVSITQIKNKLPEEFMDNLYEMFSPGTVDNILRGIAEKRFTTLRVNNLKYNIQDLMKYFKEENIKFEIYKDEEITGAEVTTLINKAINSNQQNEIEKDKKGRYIDNETNSINIDIKFIDDDVTYNIEKIYNNGMDKFLTYYRDIKFKCVDVQYHDKTQKIKYMLFEQITQ